MARNEATKRQFLILQILQRSRFGRTINDLTQEVVQEMGTSSLSTRTIRRDLDALNEAIPLTYKRSQEGGLWKLESDPPEITASLSEVISLSIGRDLLCCTLAGTPYAREINMFIQRIEKTLSPVMAERLKETRKKFSVIGDFKSYEKHELILATINQAIENRRTIIAMYQSWGAKAPRERKIEPYAITIKRPSLYIIGPDVNEPTIMRHWKLDRFSKVRVMNTLFKPRRAFDLDRHLDKGAGIFIGPKQQEYQIHVGSKASRLVLEDPWHPKQKIKKLPNGGLELRVVASHDQEIVQRVLSFAGEAKVIQPKSCKIAIYRSANKMTEEHIFHAK